MNASTIGKMTAMMVLLAGGSVLAAPPAKAAGLAVSPLFTDHMVLQRDKPLPVWGTAPAGTKVTVRFASQEKSVEADGNGKWMVKLDPVPLKAEPQKLVIFSSLSPEPLTLSDVLVGDVYLCAGQSNMEVAMKEYGRPEDMKAATFPLIRHYDNIKRGGTWQACTPETVNGFTAVGFYFGRRIHQETKIPVGLIKNALSSSRIERWIPTEGYAFMSELLDKNGKPRAMAWDKYGQNHSQYTAQLIPYAIRGMLWYQGEQNIWKNDNEIAYFQKLKGLIGGLRALFGVGDFPVYIVQLPSMGAPAEGTLVSDGGKWTDVRMGQFRSLAIKNTGMAVTLDLNDPPNIHPANKVDVGDRLALIALAKDYGKTVAFSGPLYREMKVQGSRIRLTFDHAEGGLMVGVKNGCEPVREVPGGKLALFAIAQMGSDGNLMWGPAEAVIENQTVVVSNPMMPKPVAVRYAYGDNVHGANLYNKAGLPASPFRTDNW